MAPVSTRKARPLSRREYIRIAVFADVEERAVKNYFERCQQPQRATVQAVRRALAELGIPDPHADGGGP